MDKIGAIKWAESPIINSIGQRPMKRGAINLIINH